MLGVVYQIVLLQLTILTSLNIDWMHTGRIRTLYTIFVLNYKEPEVLVKNLDMNNSLYKYVISVKWGGLRGLGLHLLFRYVYVYGAVYVHFYTRPICEVDVHGYLPMNPFTDWLVFVLWLN